MEDCIIIGCSGGRVEYRLRKRSDLPADDQFWQFQERYYDPDAEEYTNWTEAKVGNRFGSRYRNPVSAMTDLMEKFGWLNS